MALFLVGSFMSNIRSTLHRICKNVLCDEICTTSIYIQQSFTNEYKIKIRVFYCSLFTELWFIHCLFFYQEYTEWKFAKNLCCSFEILQDVTYCSLVDKNIVPSSSD
jgi:hypothetical protein